MRIGRTLLACLGLVVFVPMMANATTIDFSSLSTAGSGISNQGLSITQSGFTISSTSELATWQASSPNLPGLSPANTSLFQFFAGGVTTITDGGSTFTLNSIDLAPLLAGGTGVFTVTLVGTEANSSLVSLVVAVNDSGSGAPKLQTFNLGGFTDLVSVSFVQGTNIGYFGQQDTAYQFNNLVLNGSPVTTPEPGTLPLLAMGAGALLGIALIRRVA